MNSRWNTVEYMWAEKMKLELFLKFELYTHPSQVCGTAQMMAVGSYFSHDLVLLLRN